MDSLEDLEGEEEREREGIVIRRRREREERIKMEFSHRRTLLRTHKKL
jgi:hypothetical protein